MKNEIYKILLMFIACTFVLASCSDDDDVELLQEEEMPKIELEQESIEIEVGTTSSVSIKDGAGEYSAFSANPDIATVTLENNEIKINTHSLGQTSIIISDNNSQYNEVSVTSFYSQILLEEEDITIKKRLGHTGVGRIRIAQGNEGYQVSSESENISVSIDNDVIVITAFAEGEAIIKLTDSYGLELSFTVTISDTTIPYNQEQLDEIMANDQNRYYYNETSIGRTYYTQHNSFEDGVNLIGQDYRGYRYYFLVYFPGDKSVGKKEGTTINAKIFRPRVIFNEEVEFEIIKNDGTKIWAIYSFVMNNKLVYGHFCQLI
ncbi:hypothetical protein [Marinifilum sp.]|uniref:hypothetical protein n=1 Tax=Marinifilum sp. TaxID=2033137 RepID=UPI003BAD06D3